MSDTQAPAAEPAPTPIPSSASTDGAAKRAPRSGTPFGLTALLLAVVLVVLYLGVRVASVAMSVNYVDDFDAPALVLGVLGLVAVLPVVAVIVLGHLGAAFSRRSHRGGVVSGMALGVGYVMLLMWGNRIVSAVIAAAGFGDPGHFVHDIFWWV
ncbi:MAG: hypothetical protein J0G30_13345 [Actinomycetales bacterium]|nr:hypothetical protein [Actinomycetales bacterium]